MSIQVEKSYKEIMREEFKESIYIPLLRDKVEWYDILSMNDRDKISVTLSNGKRDDGLYYLYRKGATLHFYRAGYFGKLIFYADEGGIISFSAKECRSESFGKIFDEKCKQEGCKGSGSICRIIKFPSFFAVN